MESNLPVVSVIIPVYNAQATLHISLDSLAGQTYKELELIFVNDCSTDASLKVIEQFVASLSFEQAQKAKVVTHQRNRGVAVARNTGLEHATGEYICYVDADDWMERDAIALIVDRAQKEQADIVGFNWYLSFERNERTMNQPAFDSPEDALTKILQGSMRWNLWLFVARRALYEQHAVRFIPDMNMGEDLLVSLKLFSYADKVTFIDKPLYHYGQSNSASITKTYSDSHIKEVSRNIQEAERFLLSSPYAALAKAYMSFLKLNIKLPMLISGDTNSYEKWNNWFTEANGAIGKNKAWPLRTRFIQIMAVNKQYWVLRLYYHLVVRFVYGVLYK